MARPFAGVVLKSKNAGVVVRAIKTALKLAAQKQGLEAIVTAGVRTDNGAAMKLVCKVLAGDTKYAAACFAHELFKPAHMNSLWLKQFNDFEAKWQEAGACRTSVFYVNSLSFLREYNT